MKLSLDSIGYGGYFTAPGEQTTLEDAMRRASGFGYDAVCIYAHRPIGFPLDLGADRRKALKDLAQELDLEFGARNIAICGAAYLSQIEGGRSVRLEEVESFSQQYIDKHGDNEEADDAIVNALLEPYKRKD